MTRMLLSSARLSALRCPLLRTHATRMLSTIPRPEVEELVQIEDKARQFAVRLTKQETAALVTQLDASGDGLVQRSEFDAAGRRLLRDGWTRDVLLSAIERPRSAMDVLGARLVNALDYFGTALFACVGVQVAGGEAGMNLVGCTLVGCVAAMGGGTVNNLLHGAAREGVFWVRNPSFLMVALTSSLVTFFAWPRYCQQAAAAELEAALVNEGCPFTNGADGADLRTNRTSVLDGSLSCDAFATFLQHNPKFAARACAALKIEQSCTSHEQLFALIDSDGSGAIEVRSPSNLHPSPSTNTVRTVRPLHRLLAGA